MKNLTIVIRDNYDDILKYIEVLKPLIDDYESEIILINNDDKLKNIDIPYEYTIYNFSQDYGKFKKFCFESSLNEKIMIIENGIKLDEEIINLVKNHINNDEYYNLVCDVKKYMDTEKKDFYIDKYTLLYTRGIKGFENKANLTVEDYSLVNIEESNYKIQIQKSVKNFVKAHRYNEMEAWYKKYLLHLGKMYAEYFYECLELQKEFLNEENIDKLEEVFMTYEYEKKSNQISEEKSEEESEEKSEEKCDENYVNYLKLNKFYRKNDVKNFLENMKKIKVSYDEIYYSFLLRKLIVDKKYADEFLEKIDAKVQKKLFEYILEKYNDFYNDFYNYLIQSESAASNTELLYMYIDCMKNISEKSEMKKKLVDIFELYIKSYENSRYPHFYGEDKFVFEIKNVQYLIENGEIENALYILNKSWYQAPAMFKLVRYYTKKIRCIHYVYPFKLSICMIVKDESKNLDRCLTSLQPIIDNNLAELIIVDTGSSDNSIEIARKYTKNVFCHKWSGNFAEARNYSILLGDGEYVFIVDADEEFSDIDIEKVKNEFSNEDYKNYNTFTLKLVSFTKKNKKDFAILTQPRIFRNDGLFYYSSAVHNQPVSDLPIKYLDIDMLHYGYIMTPDIKEKKFKRTSTLLKKELEKTPDNLYYRYQLSTSYAMYGDMRNALKQAEIYMRYMREKIVSDDIFLMYYNNAATIYINCCQFDDVLRICDDALIIQPSYIDFVYYKAYALFYKREYEESLKYMKNYYDLFDNYENMDIINDGRFSFYSLSYKDEADKLYIIMNYKLNKFENCLKMMHEVKNNCALKNCIYELVNSCFIEKQYSDIGYLYKRIITDDINSSTHQPQYAYIFKYFLLENMFKLYSKKSAEALNCSKGPNAGAEIIEKALSEKEILEKALSEKEILKKDTLEKALSEKEMLKKDTLEKALSKKEILKKDTLEKALSKKEILKKDTLEKEISKKEILKKEISEKVISDILEVFTKYGMDKEYVFSLTESFKGNKYFDENEIFKLVSVYDVDTLEFDKAYELLSRLMNKFNKFDIDACSDYSKMQHMKEYCQYVLHRTKDILEYEYMNIAELANFFDKYMNICSKLLKNNKEDLIEAREKLFIAKILSAFNYYKAQDYKKTVKLMNDSVFDYNYMGPLVENIIKILIPQDDIKDDAEDDAQSNVENHAEDNAQDDAQSNVGNDAEDNAEDDAQSNVGNDAESNAGNDAEDNAQDDAQSNVENDAESNAQDDAESNVGNDAESNAQDDAQSNVGNDAEDNAQSNVGNDAQSNAHLHEIEKTNEIEKTVNHEEKAVPENYSISKNNTDLTSGRIDTVKVLHGTIDLTDKTVKIVNALKKEGICARSLNYNSQNVGYSSDYVMNVNSFKNGDEILKRTSDTANKLINEFDIFHFYYMTSLLFNHYDLNILNKLDKKIIMQFDGNQVRMSSKAAVLNPYAEFINMEDEESIKNKLNKLSKNISCCVVNNYEIYEYVKDYFEKTVIIDYMTEVDSIKAVPQCNTKFKNKNCNINKFVIAYAADLNNIKIVEHILNVMDKLKMKHNCIDFRFIQDSKVENVIKQYRDADLIIDDMVTGNYGRLAVEAMALGKPVLSYITDFMRCKYPQELPIIIANLYDIEQRIEYILNNRDMLPEIGIHGRKYAENYHTTQKLINKIIKLYK